MKCSKRISPFASRYTLTAMATLLLWGVPKAVAASYVWTGLGTTGNFSEDANWNVSGALPAANNDYLFSGNSHTSISLDTKNTTSSWQAASLTFDATADSFNVGGYAPGATGANGSNRFVLTPTSSITQNSVADQRISSVLYLASGTATVSGNGAGALFLDAIRFNAGNAGAFVFNRSATIGTISSAGTGTANAQIIISSAGTLTFSQATTGSLTSIEINSSTDIGNAVQASNPDGLISSALVRTSRNLTFQGASKMEFQGGFILGGNASKALTFSNTGGTTFSTKPIELGANTGNGARAVTFDVATGATATMSAVVSGTSSTGATSLIKSGKGILALTAANTYNGGTTVTDGQLLVGNTAGSATGTGSVQITGGLLGGTGRIAPNGGLISISNAIVAVGQLNDAAKSGISQLSFAKSGGSVSFTLDSTSAIHLDLWSATDYERIAFNLDTISLGGASLVLQSSFGGLAKGQTYTLFDWGGTTPTGTFSQFILPTLSSDLFWDTGNLYRTGEISIIPEPGSIALVIVLLGLGGVQYLCKSRFSRKLSLSLPPLLLTAAVATTSLQASDTNWPLQIAHEEAVVEKNSCLKQEITIAATPVNHDLVLELTAWYQGNRPSGFLQHMKVFLDGEELTDILDRPATFTAKDERPRETRGVKGWRVAILSSPDDPKNSDSPYFVSKEELPDITRFRFRLPQVTSGAHEIEIKNMARTDTLSDGSPLHSTLKVREITIVSVPK